MSDRMNIEELVRTKLGDAERTPSPGAWKAVRTRLRFRRFMRFDPATFNVWYLGALVAAGSLVVALTLPVDPEEETGTREFPLTSQQDRPFAESGEDRPGPVQEETGDVPPETATKGGISKEAPARTGRQRAGETTESTPDIRTSPGQEKDSPEPAPDTSATAGDVLQTMVTYFTPSALSGCAPLEVDFLNTTVNAAAFSWSFGDGTGSKERSPVHTYTEPGTYAVVLRAFSADGNSMSHRQSVEVFPSPKAGFEIGEGLEGFDGSRSLEMINYTIGAVTYHWAFVAGEDTGQEGWTSEEFQPLIGTGQIPSGVSRIRLIATSFEGCADTALAAIPGLEEEGGPGLKFPTAFEGNHTGPSGGAYSPNEVRMDLFHPHFTEQPAEYRLQVFSRMGELIFESRDVFVGWDGYLLQERAASGVYLWVADGIWPNGETFSMKGDVTLLWSDRNWP